MAISTPGVAIGVKQAITYTGQVISMSGKGVRLDQIDIIDIAHALSMLCRYNGHVARFYSVAEHSCGCYDVGIDKFLDPQMCFALLMHDAAEAYASDMISPMRKLRKLKGFNKVIARFERLISEAFHIPAACLYSTQLKIIDAAMADQEQYRLCPGMQNSRQPHDLSVRGREFSCWPPEEAEEQFIKRFTECKNKL